MRRLLKILEWVGTIIVCLIVLLAALFMIAPRFGIQTHPVMSGSMEPVLRVGGLVITKPTPTDSIKVGDIIGFKNSSGKMVSHRVVDISSKDGKLWFQTKGDANNTPDKALVSPMGNKVDKVIYHVPYLGYFANFMKTRWVFFPVVGIPAAILLVFFSIDFWKGVNEEKAKRRTKASARRTDMNE